MARTTRTTPATTKAVGYIRVSTDKQADHGISLDAQRTKLEAYAALYDIELVAVIVDAGVSAKTLQRPGLQQALGMLRRGEADALLVAKLDRLTRSVKDLGTLLDAYFRRQPSRCSRVADSYRHPHRGRPPGAQRADVRGTVGAGNHPGAHH